MSITDRIDNITRIPEDYLAEAPPAPKSVKIELYHPEQEVNEGLEITRYDAEPGVLVKCEDGDWVSYSAMQHHYRECLDHGLTLEEAIRMMEEKNGP